MSRKIIQIDGASTTASIASLPRGPLFLLSSPSPPNDDEPGRKEDPGLC
jgi:hypothetical protein